MPTSWTFVPLQEKVYVFRNGKRIVMSSGNHDILPDVCEVEVISESDVLRSKIKWKKEDGVRVVFSDQKKVVLKVCDFIWNDNEFSRQFKDVTTAESFVSTFEKRTYISASEMETQEPLYMAEIVDLIPDTPVPFNKQTSLTSSKRKTLIPVLMSPVEPAIKKTNSLEEKMLDGLYQIELKQISEAPENIRLRDIDSDFVDQIKTEMELSGNIATQPLALCIPNLKEDEFEESNINNYDFICLGGNHLRCAYEKLHKKHAFAKIYVDLTDEECLIVAKFHNEVGHYVKELTNFDMVQLFRRQLNTNSAERVNNLVHIKEWRERIAKLLPHNKDLRSYQPLTNLAMMGSRAYSKVVQVFHMYEQGTLKDQKPIKKGQGKITLTAIRPWRAVMTLAECDVIQFLDRIIEKEWSIDQFQRKCEEIKDYKKLQKKMIDHLDQEWASIKSQYYGGDDTEAEAALHPYLRLTDSSEFDNYIKKLKSESNNLKKMKTTTGFNKADLVFLAENEVSEDVIRRIHSKNIEKNVKMYTILSTSEIKEQAEKVGYFAYGKIAYTLGKQSADQELREVHIMYVAQFGTKNVRVTAGNKPSELLQLKDFSSMDSLFKMFISDGGVIFLMASEKKNLLPNFNLINTECFVHVKSESEKKSLKRKFHFIEE